MMQSPDSSEAKPQTQRIDPATGDVPYPRREADEIPDNVTPVPGIDEPLKVTIMERVLSTREHSASKGVTGIRRVQDGAVAQVLGSHRPRKRALLRVETESAPVIARLCHERDSASVIGFPLTDGAAPIEITSTNEWYLHSSGGFTDIHYLIEELES